MMRKSLLRAYSVLLIFVMLPLLLFSGCGLLERLEAVGAGYEKLEDRIFSVSLNSAARELFGAINSGDAQAVSAMVSGADEDSAERLVSLFGKISGYRIREESRHGKIRVCLLRAEGDNGVIRARLVFDESGNDGEDPRFRMIEAASGEDFAAEGFCFSADTENSGIFFPRPSGNAGCTKHPALDRLNCPEDYDLYDQYHELGASYLQSVVSCLENRDPEGLKNLFSTQILNSGTLAGVEAFMEGYKGKTLGWKTSGSYAAVIGDNADEYDEEGKRVPAAESDRREHLKAMFAVTADSGDYDITLSVWVKNDPEPYRFGLEGIKLTDGSGGVYILGAAV